MTAENKQSCLLGTKSGRPSKQGAPSWLLKFAWKLTAHSFQKAASSFKFGGAILFSPTTTSQHIILDDDPKGIVRALKYYSKTFAIAFAIYLIAGRFQLYDGESEWRFLITVAAQVAVGTVILFALSFLIADRAPLLRLVQAVLYVDGVFLIVLAVISIPTNFFNYLLTVQSGSRELVFLLLSMSAAWRAIPLLTGCFAEILNSIYTPTYGGPEIGLGGL